MLIAWLNLDLGIETCFYNAIVETGFYAKVKDDQNPHIHREHKLEPCLRVRSHPIDTTRHSVLLSRLIGSDPIAVLATLLLKYTELTSE